VHLARVDDPAGVLRAADAALSLADSLGLPQPYRALMYRALALISMRAPEGESEFRAGMERVMAAGDTRLGLFMLGELAQTRDGDQALDAINEAEAFAARYGLPGDRLDWMRIELLDFLGRWDEVLEAIPPVVARAESRGDVSTRFAMQWIRGLIELERGVDVDVDGFTAQAVALGLGEHFTHGMATRHAYLAGDLATARKVVVETLDRLPDGETVTAVFFVTVALASRDLALAHRVLTRAYPESTPRMRGVLTKLARGLVLEAEGDFVAARALFEESAAWFRPRTASLPTREAVFALG